MSVRRVQEMVLATAIAVTGLVMVPAGPAMAQGDTTISSSGPLHTITISTDLNCDVRHVLDTIPEWFGQTACGTFVALNGTLFGPSSIPAGGSLGPYTPFTPVSQSSEPTGDGTAADPYTIVTVVRAGNLAELTQTDRYVVGDEYYRTDVQVTNISGSPLTGNIYAAGDCYLANDDYGYGRILGTVPACTRTSEPGSRLLALVPRIGGNNYLEDGYSQVWAAVGTKLPLPDRCRCETRIDNGIAISWPLRIPAGETHMWAWTTTFSPEGHLPLVVSATAHDAASPARGFDGYRISISNGNPESAVVHSITVTIPPGFTYVPGTTRGVTSADPVISGRDLTWTGPFTISGGGEIGIDFDVRVAAEPGTYTIDANATADHDVTPALNAAAITVGAVADLSLTKVATPPDYAPSPGGNSVTYTLTAHNAGPSTAPDPVITDVLPSGFTFYAPDSTPGCFAVGQLVHCDVGSLPPDASTSLTVAIRAAYGTPYGFHYNDAVVSDTGVHDPDPLNNYAVAPVLTRGARLQISKTARPVFAGSNLTWTMNVVNTELTSATGGVVTDTLPEDLEYVSAHTDSGSCSFSPGTRVLTCTLGTLAPDETATITLVTRTPANLVPPGDTSAVVSNPASVTHGTMTENTIGQTRVFAAAHLVPAKTVSPAPLVAGGVVSYEDSATNEGPSVATSINVADSLPEGMTFDAAASDPRCTLIDEATRTIRCFDPGPLAEGESVRFKIVARVSETLGDGSVVVNDASVTAAQLDTNPAENARATSIVVRHVSLDITKVPSRHVIRAGERYFYKIRVINNGPSAAGNVVISDRLVRGALLGGVRAGAKGAIDCPVTGVQFRCVIPELLAGDAVTFAVPVMVPRGTPSGVIVNTATVTSADRGLARATASVLVLGRQPVPRRPRPIPRVIPVTG